MATPDALRSSLDTHEVDRKAGRDRTYVESALRRIQAQGHTVEVSYTETAEALPSEDTPAFSPVKAVKHPRKADPEPADDADDVPLSSKEERALRRAERRAIKKGDVLEMEFEEVADKPAEVQFKEVTFKEVSKKHAKEDDVLWKDVTEGEDPNLKPDPKAGYMKGEYALFRRTVDMDHAVYFFATEVPDDAEQARIPEGYEVRLTEETRLPYIARKGKAEYLNQTELIRAKDRDQAVEIAARKGIGGLHLE